MTDEDGQEPDMSDAEIAKVERDQIMKCDEDYSDDLDFICNYMSALSEDMRSELAGLIKQRAVLIGNGKKDNHHFLMLASFGDRMIEAMGEQVYNEHRL